MADVASFAGDSRGDETSADMAVYAVDPGMWRGEVAGEFGWHGMASRAAELGRVGIFPTPDSTR